jgi:hypothetical protein
MVLLDLRGNGAMRAGSVVALGSVADRSLSQAWSRYFYENPNVYQPVDGVIYHNAHNGEDALALYERAERWLVDPTNQIGRLDDQALRPLILDIALHNNLDFL